MKRLQTFGIFATLLAVAILTGSLVSGLARDGRTAVGSPAAPAAAAPRGQRVRVEVRNAAGAPGLAREVTGLLRDRGFDVVEFGNAQAAHGDRSRVLDRVGRPERARAIADALGIGTVVAAPDSNLYLDATVVLGRDWKREQVQPALEDVTVEPR